MSAIDLKPCPFCGGTNQFVILPTCKENDPYDPADRAMPIVRCMGCYTDVPGKDWDHRGKSAVEAWNRRDALSASPVNVEPVAWLPADEAPRGAYALIRHRSGEIDVAYKTNNGEPFLESWRYAGTAKRGEQAPWPDTYLPVSAIVASPVPAHDTEFKPCVIYYEDGDFSQMLLEDRTTITGRPVVVDPLYRMDDTRSIVGFQWAGKVPPIPARDALREAALAVLKSWDERGTEQERFIPAVEAATGHAYWSPAASLVSSEPMSRLRAALQQGEVGE